MVARRVLGAAGVAGAIGVAWFVLVVLRFQAPIAYRSLTIARLDASVASGRQSDHMLSVATWVGYVVTTVVVGALAFRTVLARVPGRLPLRAAVTAGVVAAAVSLPLRAAEVTGVGLTAITDLEVLRHVVASAFGGAMALRAGGLLLLGASLRGEGRARWPAITGRVVGAGVLLASYLVIGHAQASDPAVLEIAALAVHILAAATWFGGVAALARDLGPANRGGRRLTGNAIERFSRTAEVMVVLVLVSGLVLAEGQNVLNAAPWKTGYGLAFTVKLGFVAVVLAIGGYNRQRVVPAIAERDDAAARRHLRATCVLEALVISMGVLLMTAAMTSGGF